MTNEERAALQHAGYLEWRQKVPWTDDQILSAFQQYVDEPVAGASVGSTEELFVRTGRLHQLEYFARTRRLSRKILGICLPYLIKTCALCGKVALYRIGNEGRCKTHRLAPAPLVVSVRRQRYEQRNAMFEREKRDADYRDLARERLLHNTWKRHR